MADAMKQISRDVDYLVSSWPGLVTLAVPSTSSRRPAVGRRDQSEDARARREEEAREDRAAARLPGAVPGTGPVPAPAHVGLLDLLARIVSVAADVAETVTQTAGVERPAPPTSSWVDPRPYFIAARLWLQAAQLADERTVPWVAQQVGPLVVEVARMLGEVHDGQVLDALCPWCKGRTAQGEGRRTLVVQLPRTENPDHGPVIVCRGDGCEPPLDKCGMRVGGRPAWNEREWDWLAKLLDPLPEVV